MPIDLKILFFILVALGIFNPIWRGLKYKHWKLGFKESARDILWIGSLLWCCFFIVSSVAVLPSFIDVVNALKTDYIWMKDALPIFYVLTLWIILILVVVKALKWRPKYTDEEKEILKSDRIWMREHLGPLGKLVKVEEKGGYSKGVLYVGDKRIEEE